VEDVPILNLEIIAWVIVLSVMSEVLFPLLSAAFTPDWYDVLVIVFGGVWFVCTKDGDGLSVG
jgi:hypothetical protein